MAFFGRDCCLDGADLSDIVSESTSQARALAPTSHGRAASLGPIAWFVGAAREAVSHLLGVRPRDHSGSAGKENSAPEMSSPQVRRKTLVPATPALSPLGTQFTPLRRWKSASVLSPDGASASGDVGCQDGAASASARVTPPASWGELLQGEDALHETTDGLPSRTSPGISAGLFRSECGDMGAIFRAEMASGATSTPHAPTMQREAAEQREWLPIWVPKTEGTSPVRAGRCGYADCETLAQRRLVWARRETAALQGTAATSFSPLASTAPPTATTPSSCGSLSACTLGAFSAPAGGAKETIISTAPAVDVPRPLRAHASEASDADASRASNASQTRASSMAAVAASAPMSRKRHCSPEATATSSPPGVGAARGRVAAAAAIWEARSTKVARRAPTS
mmetsp:Transcript_41575/g.114535  ORF Transcript_41575/g.114535 Transcript_41575/m.114535 type:complete len:397 (-) Transcript_41575:94-1284(-)